MQWYEFNYNPPANSCIEELQEEILKIVRPIAEIYGLEMEPFSARQRGLEWVQGVSLNAGTSTDPWSIGSILRQDNGEFRLWARGENFLPFVQLRIIDQEEVGKLIEEMVDEYTSP